jgi:hypothetical protein
VYCSIVESDDLVFGLRDAIRPASLRTSAPVISTQLLASILSIRAEAKGKLQMPRAEQRVTPEDSEVREPSEQPLEIVDDEDSSAGEDFAQGGSGTATDHHARLAWLVQSAGALRFFRPDLEARARQASRAIATQQDVQDALMTATTEVERQASELRDKEREISDLRAQVQAVKLELAETHSHAARETARAAVLERDLAAARVGTVGTSSSTSTAEPSLAAAVRFEGLELDEIKAEYERYGSNRESTFTSEDEARRAIDAVRRHHTIQLQFTPVTMYDLLGVEQYASDVHFVEELLQNPNDKMYV